MKVSEAMTANVRTLLPDQTIRDAARLMADLDAEIVPMGEKDRLIGMLTDRDIAVRAVAQSKGPDTLAREVMTAEIRYCYDDEDCAAAAQMIGELQIRRLPVVNQDKRLVSIISHGDFSTLYSSGSAGGALGHVSEPEEMRSTTCPHGHGHGRQPGRCTGTNHRGRPPMVKRTHPMTDPSPNRLDREQACALDRHPAPMHAGKSHEVTASTKRPSDASKTAKR